MQALFEMTETQALMQASLQRWLDDNARFELRAGLLHSPQAITPLWQGLAHELGVLGAGLPEAMGGLGGGLADHLLICQALGAALLPDPYLACAVTAGSLLQQLAPEAATPWLAGLADGRLRPVLATLEPGARHDLAQVAARLTPDGARITGRKALVRAAPWATHWLVSARDGQDQLQIVVVDPTAPGITRRDVRLADGGWAAELDFSLTPVLTALPMADGGCALPALVAAMDHTLLAAGAEAVGLMQRLMTDTLDYLRQRKQFGVPLASFQVLQHRVADMHMAALQAQALVGATLAQMNGPVSQRRRAVASAQVAVARACRTVGQGAVQLHGGMGMTEELPVGHAFKRLTLIEHHLGGVDHHLRQVALHSAATA
jgi:alkylation response protein AidB-like acyl-CoA dehydrogenase